MFFDCLPLCLPHWKVPWRSVLGRVLQRMTCLSPNSFLLFLVAKRSFLVPASCVTRPFTKSFVLCSFQEILKRWLKKCVSNVWTLVVSAIGVQLSHPYGQLHLGWKTDFFALPNLTLFCHWRCCYSESGLELWCRASSFGEDNIKVFKGVHSF